MKFLGLHNILTYSIFNLSIPNKEFFFEEFSKIPYHSEKKHFAQHNGQKMPAILNAWLTGEVKGWKLLI